MGKQTIGRSQNRLWNYSHFSALPPAGLTTTSGQETDWGDNPRDGLERHLFMAGQKAG
jgi:hypothetical protein